MIFSYYNNLLRFVIYKIFGIYPDKKSRIITNHTFEKSFKFPEKYTNSRLIVFKYFITILKYKVNDLKTSYRNSNLILDAKSSSKEHRIKYLKHFTKINDFDFISYNELLFFKSNFQKFTFFIHSLPMVILMFIVSQFYNNRSSFALTIEYAIILKNFFKIINSNSKLDTIYYFSIVERESNIFAYFFQRSKIKVVKVASDTPIGFWNQNILSNDLIVCNKYQYDEIEFFKRSINIDKAIYFGPELSLKYNNLYDSNTRASNNTIGFYSTASWVRSAEGHIDQGIDFMESEKKVISCLKNILLKNKNLKLYIFLHPKEKNCNYLLKSFKYYKNLFEENIPYEIVESPKSSSELFHKVDLGVAFNSTILHERIYCGFKTLFYPNNPNFPIKNSVISNICAKSDNHFESLIYDALETSTFDFFSNHNLSSFSNRVIKKI